jgi:hypothetical protein
MRRALVAASTLSLLGMLGCGSPAESDPTMPASGKEDVGPNDHFEDAVPARVIRGRIVYGATWPTDQVRVQVIGSLCQNDDRQFMNFKPPYQVRSLPPRICADTERDFFPSVDNDPKLKIPVAEVEQCVPSGCAPPDWSGPSGTDERRDVVLIGATVTGVVKTSDGHGTYVLNEEDVCKATGDGRAFVFFDVPFRVTPPKKTITCSFNPSLSFTVADVQTCTDADCHSN